MAKRKEQEADDSPRTLFAVKGRPTWHAWLKGYADSIGTDVMGAIDAALRQQAKRDGYEDPMPKRMTRAKE